MGYTLDRGKLCGCVVSDHDPSTAMKCDLVTSGNVKYCIRCRAIVQSQMNYRTCDQVGIGDRVFYVTQWLGFKSCESCVQRRMRLNELDRRIYRRIYQWLVPCK